MRILIADTYYDAFLAEFEQRRRDLADQPYAQQHAALMAEHFGTGDAYAAELRALGCEAQTVVLNARTLQRQWAIEHGLAPGETRGQWDPAIFLEQVRAWKPDVVYVQELSVAADDFWREVRGHVRLLAGQIACSPPRSRTFAHHDLIISSWPPIVEYFREHGKPACFVRLGFDRAVLDALGEVPPRHEVTFVGGLSAAHGDRIRWLEELCRAVPIDVFGYGVEALPVDSAIRARHRGPAWGLAMYRAIAASRVTLNHHLSHTIGGRTARDLANNCRLFEATGVGTALITDQKHNLGEYFLAGREVAAYRDVQDCIAQIQTLLGDEPRRAAMARSGQQRTLAAHTYAHRLRDILAVLEARLAGKRLSATM